MKGYKTSVSHLNEYLLKDYPKVHLNRPFDPIKGSIVDYDVLFIDTADEGNGTDTITLRANDGEFAVVRLWVR